MQELATAYGLIEGPVAGMASVSAMFLMAAIPAVATSCM